MPCKTNPPMKNKQALLSTKALDSVKGCRTQFSLSLRIWSVPRVLLSWSLERAGPSGRAGRALQRPLRSLLSPVCFASLPLSSQVPREPPPWQAKHKPTTPWQRSFSFPRGPGRLCKPRPKRPLRTPPKRDSLENGGLNTCVVPAQVCPGPELLRWSRLKVTTSSGVSPRAVNPFAAC